MLHNKDAPTRETVYKKQKEENKYGFITRKWNQEPQ